MKPGKVLDTADRKKKSNKKETRMEHETNGLKSPRENGSLFEDL